MQLGEYISTYLLKYFLGCDSCFLLNKHCAACNTFYCVWSGKFVHQNNFCNISKEIREYSLNITISVTVNRKRYVHYFIDIGSLRNLISDNVFRQN